jgi:hypothetical protein
MEATMIKYSQQKHLQKEAKGGDFEGFRQSNRIQQTV